MTNAGKKRLQTYEAQGISPGEVAALIRRCPSGALRFMQPALSLHPEPL